MFLPILPISPICPHCSPPSVSIRPLAVPISTKGNVQSWQANRQLLSQLSPLTMTQLTAPRPNRQPLIADYSLSANVEAGSFTVKHDPEARKEERRQNPWKGESEKRCPLKNAFSTSAVLDKDRSAGCSTRYTLSLYGSAHWRLLPTRIRSRHWTGLTVVDWITTSSCQRLGTLWRLFQRSSLPSSFFQVPATSRPNKRQSHSRVKVMACMGLVHSVFAPVSGPVTPFLIVTESIR